MGIDDTNRTLHYPPEILRNAEAAPGSNFFKTCCTWCCCLFCFFLAFLFLMYMGGKKDMDRIEVAYQESGEGRQYPPYDIPSRPTVNPPKYVTVSKTKTEKPPAQNPTKPEIVTVRPSENCTEEEKHVRPTCLTGPCLKVVGTMKSLIKESTSPCDNFYEHACGNFDSSIIQRTEKPSKKFPEEAIIALEKAADLVENRVEELSLPSEINLRKVYLKCLRRDHRDVEDLMDTLNKDFLWPFSDRKDMTWTGVVNHILGKLIKLSPKSLQIFSIVEKDKQLIIKSSFCHGKHKPIDLKIVKKMFDAVSKDSENEHRQFLEKSLNISLELDRVREYCTEQHPPKNRHREFTVDYDTSSIDFLGIIGQILGPDALTKEQLNSSIKFEESHEFFDEKSFLNSLLHHNSIGFAHYLVIKYIEQMGAHLLLPAQKHCTKIAFSMMPRTALSIYMNHFVQPENVLAIPHLIDTIRAEYSSQISESGKLDDKTKNQILKQIKSFKTDIGTHGIGFSENNILERVHIHSRDSFYKVYTEFNTENMQEALKSMATDETVTGNTHTRSIFNEQFPIGKIFSHMISQPRFDINFPVAVQFGKAGHDVASDMSTILKTLNKKNQTEVEKSTKCLQGHDGDVDLSVLMDYMGMKVAWDGFKKSNRNPENFKLPGFRKMSDEQLFFYTMIQSTCQKRDSLSEVHGHRVNSLLQQIDGFGKAFQCPAGAIMVTPKQKCAAVF